MKLFWIWTLFLCRFLNNTEAAAVAPCVRTNSRPFEQCKSSCDPSLISNCATGEDCLCDGDCGFSCVKQGLDCGKPKNIKNGKVRYSSTRFDGVAVYTCHYPFTVRGKRTRQCRGNGMWSGSPATCSKGCGNPPGIRNNGRVRYRSTRPGAVAEYSCSSPYTLTGSKRRTCLTNGIWSGKRARCKIICEAEDIQNGQKNASRGREGEKVQYTCDPGYFNDGAEVLTCTNTGKWDKPKPRCEDRSYSACGEATMRARIVGGRKAERGMWPWMTRISKFSGKDNKLYPVWCGGALINPEWILTAAHCFDEIPHPMDRYKMTLGDHNVTKREDSEIEILPEKIIRHTNFSESTYENDIAVVRLPQKVTLSKFVRTLCLPDKELARPGTSGVVAGWGVTVSLRFGEGNAKAVSDVLQYTTLPVQNNSLCVSRTRYSVNQEVAFCAGDGKGKQDSCQGDSGGPFMKQETTKDGKQRWAVAGIVSWGEGCAVQNTYGYYTRIMPFVDWISQTIMQDTDPTGPALRPLEAPCMSLYKPANGEIHGAYFTHGKIVRFACNSGYQLVGASSVICYDGTWYGVPPVCKVVDCGSLKAPVHGAILNETKTTYQGITTFKCTDKGYEMKGSSRRICQSNGQWDGEETKCEIIKCDVPENPQNGRHFVSKGYFYGGSVRFECDTNYTLSSSAAIYCQENKKWSGKSPNCSAPCPPPNRPANGQRDGSDFRHEKRVSFRCSSGYQIIGASSATCNDGKWNNDPPVCKGIDCGKPKRIKNGKVRYSSTRFDGVAVYTCHYPFTVRGKRTRKCRANGMWSGPPATCSKGCGNPPGIRNNGRVQYRSTRPGAVAEYSCSSPYTLTGSKRRTCLTNGTWSGKRARCRMSFHFSQKLSEGTGRIDVNAERGLDLVFVFDGSSSVKKQDFEVGLSFAQRLVELIGAFRRPRLPVARFAAVTVGSTARLEFNLGDAEVNSTEKAVKRIGKIQRRAMGGTASALALRMVREVIVPVARDGKRFMMFITNGRSNIGGSPKKAAKKLKEQHDFEIYVIGVGDKLNSKELHRIATDDEKHVIEVERYDVIRKGLELALKLPEKDFSPCGVSKTPNRARMVGGSVAGHGVWPWMARMYRIRDGKESLDCGASLIRRQWVLTAAHCFYSKNLFGKRVSNAHIPGLFNLVLGDHNTEVQEHSEQQMVAEKIFVHESYNDKDFVNDIALVRLRKRAKLSTNVRTLCLPDQVLVIPEKRGFVAGWGVTEVIKPNEYDSEKHLSSTLLRDSAFTVQKDSLCVNKTTYHVNPNVTFCAGDGGNDTCWGDDGGPFTQEGLVDGKYRWMATGLVSWGEGCGLKDKYGYYTRVLPFVDWINKTITENPAYDDDDND